MNEPLALTVFEVSAALFLTASVGLLGVWLLYRNLP